MGYGLSMGQRLIRDSAANRATIYSTGPVLNTDCLSKSMIIIMNVIIKTVVRRTLLWCFYNTSNFLKTLLHINAIACLKGQDMSCLCEMLYATWYYTNFPRCVIFKIFQNCEITHQLLNITFIFDRCQIWMWFKEFNMYFCKIDNFASREIN